MILPGAGVARESGKTAGRDIEITGKDRKTMMTNHLVQTFYYYYTYSTPGGGLSMD